MPGVASPSRLSRRVLPTTDLRVARAQRDPRLYSGYASPRPVVTVGTTEKGAGPAMRHVHDATNSSGAPDPFFHLVASRRTAFDYLRSAASNSRPGPVLITGESGAGKHGAVRRFAADNPSRLRMATVDLAAEMNSLEFLRLVGHPLGVSSSNRLGKRGFAWGTHWRTKRPKAGAWVLVVEGAHRGRSGVWDEVQAIANQLGQSRGFGALFIVGETGLANARVETKLNRASGSGVQSYPSQAARS